MKKCLIIYMTVLGLNSSSAQTTSIQAFAQQTVMGFQKGYGLRYQTARGLGIGILFQSNGKLSAESVGNNYPFYGTEAIIPLAKCTTIQFLFTPKVGFVNRNFLVFIPEVETEINVNKLLSIGITTGIRARKSSAGVKAILHL